MIKIAYKNEPEDLCFTDRGITEMKTSVKYEEIDPKNIFVFGKKGELDEDLHTSIKKYNHRYLKEQKAKKALKYFKRNYKTCEASRDFFPSRESEIKLLMAEVGVTFMTKELYAILMEIIEDFNYSVRYFIYAGDEGRLNFINEAISTNPTRAHCFLKSMKTGPNGQTHKKILFDAISHNKT